MQRIQNILWLLLVFLTCNTKTQAQQRFGHYNVERLTMRWIDYQMLVAELEDFQKTEAAKRDKRRKEIVDRIAQLEQENKHHSKMLLVREEQNLDIEYEQKVHRKGQQTDSTIAYKLQKGIAAVKATYKLDYLVEAGGNFALYATQAHDLTLPLLAKLNQQKGSSAIKDVDFSSQQFAHMAVESALPSWRYYQKTTEKLDSLRRYIEYKQDDYDDIRKKAERGSINPKAAKTELADIRTKYDRAMKMYEQLNAELNQNIQQAITQVAASLCEEHGYDIIFNADHADFNQVQQSTDEQEQFAEMLNAGQW